jgi:hypothetical protein
MTNNALILAVEHLEQININLCTHNCSFICFLLFSYIVIGELSSHYAGRAHVPLSAGLNETLQLWMSCRATRTLIDITTQCLSCLMHSDTESCINALLGKLLASEDSCQLWKHFDCGKCKQIFYMDLHLCVHAVKSLFRVSVRD